MTAKPPRPRRLLPAATCVTLLAALPAAAQNIEDVVPPQLRAPAGAAPAPAARPAEAPPETSSPDRVLLPALRGLVFLPSLEAVRSAGVNRQGVAIEDLPALDDAAFRAEVEPMLGQPLTAGRLNQITQAVVRAFRRADRPLVDAIAPEQDITAGTVQIAVVEFRVGEIRTEGERWFSSRLIRSRLRLQPGDSVRASRVADDLAVLNENPFRRTEALYQRSEQTGRTDVILRTEDRLPLRLYAGFEDTGTRAIGVNRVFVGANYGNLFGRDHQLNYQYTTSADALTGTPDGLIGRRPGPRFLAHSATYTVALPWRDRLVFSALYAESNPWLAQPFTQTGFTTQVSARYARRLPRTDSFGQELRFGYDFKRTNNNLAFGGFRVSNTFTEVHQFALEYTATLLDRWGATSGSLTGIASPGGLSPGNGRAAFAQSREGASPQYAYALLQLERSFRLPGENTLLFRATWQMATGALLPSEQLALGGATSLRGFDSFTATGDQGWILGAELRGRPFSLLRLADGPERDRFQPLVFIEGGEVYARSAQNNQPRDIALGSVGLGFRYSLDRFLDVRFDYGFQLSQLPGGPRLGSRGHLSLVASW